MSDVCLSPWGAGLSWCGMLRSPARAVRVKRSRSGVSCVLGAGRIIFHR